MNEFGLIQKIRKAAFLNHSEVLTGIGDDCAVVKSPRMNHVLLLTVDQVVEGVHFLAGTHFSKVGRKALARSISDIAAMGGIPKYALLSLGLPKGISPKSVDQFYLGFLELAHPYSVDLIGGDISKSLKGFFASVTVIGEAPQKEVILRKGAREGDFLFVTGRLGGSLLNHHLTFRPRINEARWLAHAHIPSAMIDISDGLMGDLGHILDESKVGAYLYLNQIPISKSALQISKGDSHKALKKALWDGEDYELLFASPLKDKKWVEKFKTKFKVDLSCIGEIVRGAPKICVKDEKGKTKELSKKGFSHF
ncbi:MAG: thiamine-monophosphate kinase [Chlamydiae bacterium]|nr:thiamine-monophosphate kinase [Chlamydiota bacterium]MBI3277041.1 thiamine-monophosphate kinase [Chlamydiota bacterium]